MILEICSNLFTVGLVDGGFEHQSLPVKSKKGKNMVGHMVGWWWRKELLW